MLQLNARLTQPLAASVQSISIPRPRHQIVCRVSSEIATASLLASALSPDRVHRAVSVLHQQPSTSDSRPSGFLESGAIRGKRCETFLFIIVSRWRNERCRSFGSAYARARSPVNSLCLI